VQLAEKTEEFCPKGSFENSWEEREISRKSIATVSTKRLRKKEAGYD